MRKARRTRKAGGESAPELLGVDHVYLTVGDFERSVAFYDRLMKALGFKKGTSPIRGESHAHYYNRNFQISIRPAHGAASYNSYAPGMHHLSLRVADVKQVDEIARRLRRLKVPIEGPRRWPEYAADYYAVFFADPDGIRFEVMNFRKGRKLVRKLWNDLEGFVNPLDRLARKRSRKR